MRDEEYYEERLHRWLQDSQVLFRNAQDSKPYVFQAGYRKGVEDAYDHELASKPCEQVEADTKIDDDPGPIKARRNPAGVWVPESEELELVVSRSQSGKSQIAYLQHECTRYRNEIRDMMQAHKAEISELKHELELQREESNNLLHDYDGCKSSLIRVTKQLEDCQKSRHNIFVKFRDAQQVISDYRAKYETANELHGTVADNYDDLSAKYHDLEAKYAELEEKYDQDTDKLCFDYNNLNELLKQVQGTARELHSKCDDLAADNAMLRDKLHSMRTSAQYQYSDMEDLVREYKHTIDVVESALDAFSTDPLKSAMTHVQEVRKRYDWPSYADGTEDIDLDL